MQIWAEYRPAYIQISEVAKHIRETDGKVVVEGLLIAAEIIKCRELQKINKKLDILIQEKEELNEKLEAIEQTISDKTSE